VDKITTTGGVTFTIDEGQVTITKQDQSEFEIPIGELEEFYDRFYALEDDESGETQG